MAMSAVKAGLLTGLLLPFASTSPLDARATWQIGQTVKTTSGSYTGHAAPQANQVSEYLGVPYAKAPVGNLRWTLPTRATDDGTTKSADVSVSCPANGIFGPGGAGALPFANQTAYTKHGVEIYNYIGQTGYAYSEDCLHVNVWTKPQTGEAKKAVLLWIYGGGFGFGSITDPRYSGQHLADTQDVVVVSVGYRTNIFGFPGSASIPNNFGLWDQRMAVQWTRDNIAAFGGDPSRITMFGQSAGAAALDYYSLAFYNNDPIVNGFIEQSGTIVGVGPMPNSTSDGAPWSQAVSKAGCTSIFGSAAELACMKTKSTADLLSATAGSPGLGSIASSIQFMPTVDDVIAFSNNTDRLNAGQFIKRPLMTGSTYSEGSVIKPGAKSNVGFQLPQFVIDTITQEAFLCPCKSRAGISVANAVKTWRYVWYGNFSNIAIATGEDNSDAYHESELSTVFGTSEFLGQANTPAQNAIQAMMMGAWASFAKNPDTGLTQFGWPAYSVNAAGTGNNLLNLALHNQTGPQASSAASLDSACGSTTIPGTLPGVMSDANRKLAQSGINFHF